MRLTRRRLLHVAVGSSIALAGCGGGDGGGNVTATATPTETETTIATEETATPTETATATATATAEPGAQQKYPDYNWELLEEATPQFTTEITLRNQSFNPVIAKVPTGTVRFVNEDSYEHTVTIPTLETDRSLSGGGSAEVTVESPGRYDYVCTLHPPSMLGRLIVVEETPTPGETSTPTPTSTGTPTPTPTGNGGGGGGYY